jgi:protein SCO1/2
LNNNAEINPSARENQSMTKPFLAALQLLTLIVALSFGGRAEAVDIKYKRTVENYTIPDIVLVNQDGKKVRIAELLQSDKPVIVEFIFGTCTTICPILSAGFTNLQQKLGPNTQKVRLVSISIDPENDTPKVMKEYLKRYRAKPGWDFLTGTRSDIDKTMRALNSYVPNKMFHQPLTLIRLPETGQWIRIYGLMSTSEFMEECRKAGIK